MIASKMQNLDRGMECQTGVNVVISPRQVLIGVGIIWDKCAVCIYT